MERKRTSASRVTCAVALVLTALFLAVSLHAQETRGRITGRVTDTTKAAIPGASVTVTDAVERHDRLLDDQQRGPVPGQLPAPRHLPGRRSRSRASRSTSRTRSSSRSTRPATWPSCSRSGASRRRSASPPRAPPLNTSDANMGFTVDQKRLAELPLIHGDPYKIMGLATGLAHSGDQRLDRPYEPTHIVGYAYDGTRSNRSDLLIDGAPSTSTANPNEVIATYVPPSDLVQEFKVQTATFDAQFGNTEGGVTSIEHQVRDEPLPRLGLLLRRAEEPGRERLLRERERPGAPRHLLEPARLHPHRPGPHPGPLRREGQDLLHGRLRAHQGRAPALRRRGRLVGPDRGAAQRRLLRLLVEHHDLRPAHPRPQRQRSSSGQPFPGNIIPANRISPVSKAILEYYSLPKNPGLNGNIYDSTLPETADYSTFTGRLDQKISNNNKMFVRYSWYNRDSIYNEYLGSPGLGHLVPVPVVPGRDRRRARLQPDDRPERPLRLQPLRAQLGPASRTRGTST